MRLPGSRGRPVPTIAPTTSRPPAAAPSVGILRCAFISSHPYCTMSTRQGDDSRCAITDYRRGQRRGRKANVVVDSLETGEGGAAGAEHQGGVETGRRQESRYRFSVEAGLGDAVGSIGNGDAERRTASAKLLVPSANAKSNAPFWAEAKLLLPMAIAMSPGPAMAIAVSSTRGTKGSRRLRSAYPAPGPDLPPGRTSHPAAGSIDDNQSVDESAEATPGVECAAAPIPNPTASRPSRPRPRERGTWLSLFSAPCAFLVTPGQARE